ncbi:MAG: DEAD/DEAH box helicase [Chitinophagales bacterium]|nr:DEAD/DEAH box helicase [Chitinophagales bacterium]
MLYIIKEPNKPTRFKATEATIKELNSFKSTLANSKTLNFQFLSAEYFESVFNEASKKWTYSNKRKTQSAFVLQIIHRELRSAFLSLQGIADLPFYQRCAETNGKRYISQRATIEAEKPQIEVQATLKNGVYNLNCIIQINNQWYNLDDFEQLGALLRLNNKWYVASSNEIQLFNKLSEINQKEFRHDAKLFLENVIVPIEQTHKVNRTNCFPIEEIHVEPQKAVYLSEISGQFLTLNPQFSYDGFTVEGEFHPYKMFNIKGKEYKVVRNETVEKTFSKHLQSLHPNFAKQFNNSYFLSFADAKKKDWFLKVYHQLLDEECNILGMEFMQHFRFSEHPIETESKLLKTEGVLLFFSMKVSFGKEKVALKDLRKALLSNSSHVLLKDSSLGVLTDEWKTKYGTLIKHGKLKNNEIEIPQWIVFANKDLVQENVGLKQISQNWWGKWQKWQEEEKCFPEPKKLKATLRPYQQKGYEWLVLLSEIQAGACLADDMGLGKTLQTISFLAHLQEQKTDAHFLIVCPSSLIYNWKQEIEKFAPHLSTYIHHGSQRNLEDFFSEEAQVLITGYATLRNDIEQFSAVMWDALVLDESHYIKNLQAKTTKAIYQLHSKTKVALSGTPILNNTFDLYSQINFLLPDFLGGQEFFRNEYANPIDKQGNKEKIEVLSKLTAPFILRRTKKQVATDLPPKTESIMWCTMSQEQQDAYEYIKVRIRDSIFLQIKNEGFSGSKMGILAGITKLKQICDSPQLVQDAEIGTAKSVKMERLLNELENNLQGNKVLVFSQFNSMLKILAEEMNERNINHFHLSGETPIEKRAEMIEEFQSEQNHTTIFLLSLKAGNAGITLTAADYVFLLDPWWNTAIEQQAIDRTHRIGQDKHVFAYKMICKNTIEEKIIQLQSKKQFVSDELIKEEDGFVKQLSEEDIAFLLE